MKRDLLWTGLCLCALVVGCGDNTQEEQATRDETPAVSKETDATPNADGSPKELPPAPMPEHELNAENFINKPAPEFVVEEWLTKEPDRKGKMVMIDFWATWCGPCIRSIPKLNKFHRDHEDRLVVIGLSDESAEKVKNHPGAKINYALAIDPQARIMREIQNQYIPYMILVDPTGVVRWQGTGGYMTEEILDEMLDTYVP